MSRFLALACDVLADPIAPSGVKAAAAQALLTAIDEGVAVPNRTPTVVWGWLRSTRPSWGTVGKLGDLADRAVAEDAIAVMLDAESGNDIRDLAGDLLAGDGMARLVTEQQLRAMVDAARTREAARDACGVVVAVHRVRGLTANELRQIRDHWFGSTVPGVRERSIDIDDEITEFDLDFHERMSSDDDAEVRAAWAGSISYRTWHQDADRLATLELVRRRISVESSELAVAAMKGAEGALIEDGAHARRRHRR